MQRFRTLFAVLIFVLAMLPLSVFADAGVTGLSISPGEIVLRGRGVRQQLILSGETDGRWQDYTRQAEFRSPTP